MTMDKAIFLKCEIFMSSCHFYIFRKPDNDSPAVRRKVLVFLGNMHLGDPADKGKKYHAVSLHIHPERIRHERANRKKQRDTENYVPYAGPFDITLVKLEKYVEFLPDKASRIVFWDVNRKGLTPQRNFLIQIMPICLFGGVDPQHFDFGYVAGFGSTGFDDLCWTTKDGPNQYEQCKQSFNVNGKHYEVSFATLCRLIRGLHCQAK
jgi:hypothetical protein